MARYGITILRHDHCVVEVEADSDDEAWDKAARMVKYAQEGAARGQAMLPPGTAFASMWETTLIEPVDVVGVVR